MGNPIEGKTEMTFGQWEAAVRPSNAWVNLGPRENPTKHPNIPGTRHDHKNDAEILRAADGSDVYALKITRPSTTCHALLQRK